MQFRHDWIGEFLDLPGGVEETASLLTSVGLTTDGWEECGDTWLLDLDIPANRGDVLSHYGIAREAAAALGVPLRPLDTDFSATQAPPEVPVSIEIEEPELCRRYTGRILEDLAPGTSPPWVDEKLESLGLRPVSNIVDATNLVLLEMGQPMHAFDLDKLAGGRIIVRRAREGETIVTLDEVERKLTPADLVIADAERPVAIAGVMGGLDTMITEDTERVLLESAWFHPKSIRATASRLGMRTDASIRFERGADAEATLPAADRFCRVLEGLGGGRFLKDPVDVYPGRQSLQLTMRWDRADSLMGVEMDRDRLRGVFEALGFRIRNDEEGSISVDVPSWRADVRREIDLVEEAARHNGFDRIPSTLPGWSSVHVSPTAGIQTRRERMRDVSAGAGFLETITFAFIPEEWDTTFRYRSDREGGPPALANPLVSHQKVMRGSLLPSLLEAAARNASRGQTEVRIFEVSKRYWLQESGSPMEAWTAAWILAGTCVPGAVWEGEPRSLDFYDLKGALEATFHACGASDITFDEGEWSFLHPAESARVRLGEDVLGPVGRVHPDIAARFEIEMPTYAAEIDLQPLLNDDRLGFELRPPSRYPWAERDLSLFVPSTVSFASIVEAIGTLQQDALRSVAPIDRYSGKGVPDGQISLTIRLRYQRDDRTLQAEEASDLAAAVVQCLSARLGAVQRT